MDQFDEQELKEYLKESLYIELSKEYNSDGEFIEVRLYADSDLITKDRVFLKGWDE